MPSSTPPPLPNSPDSITDEPSAFSAFSTPDEQAALVAKLPEVLAPPSREVTPSQDQRRETIQSWITHYQATGRRAPSLLYVASAKLRGPCTVSGKLWVSGPNTLPDSVKLELDGSLEHLFATDQEEQAAKKSWDDETARINSLGWKYDDSNKGPGQLIPLNNVEETAGGYPSAPRKRKGQPPPYLRKSTRDRSLSLASEPLHKRLKPSSVDPTTLNGNGKPRLPNPQTTKATALAHATNGKPRSLARDPSIPPLLSNFVDRQVAMKDRLNGRAPSIQSSTENYAHSELPLSSGALTSPKTISSTTTDQAALDQSYQESSMRTPFKRGQFNPDISEQFIQPSFPSELATSTPLPYPAKSKPSPIKHLASPPPSPLYPR